MSSSNVVGAFSAEATARLTGLSVTQLKLWDRDGFLKPSYAAENRHLPYSRVYSFRDIVSLRVLGQLRNVHKVPMQHLKKVSRKLADFGDEKWTATTLYVLGKRVVFDDPRSNERKEIVSGQRVFDIPLKLAISDTHEEIDRLNRRDADKVGHIVRERFVMQNEPVFDGTRIPVAAVRRYLAAGYSADQIISEFPQLTLDDVDAARDFQEDSAA